MTVHVRFEKNAKNRKRKNHESRGSSWSYYEMTHDVWRSMFSFEMNAPLFAFSGEHRSILPTQRGCNSLCENTSVTDATLIKPLKEQKGNPGQNVSPSFLKQVLKTAKEQILGLTKDFRTNGLPWKGDECRSIIAGGSGILYCLPALLCNGNIIEQVRWLTQAFLSIMADYVYIDQDSSIHGIDRIFATTNTIVIILQAASQLEMIIAFTAVIPISTFILANKSKQQLNLQRWKYYHFLWHLTGSLDIALAIYLLYNCSSADNFIFNQFCTKAS